MHADSALPTVEQRKQAGILGLFSAFGSPQFRWLWGNTVFASMGLSMRQLAMGWLVLTLTDSPFYVGLAAGLQGLGLVLFGTFGGVLVDRLDRRKLLVLVQIVNGTLALTIGLLVLIDQITLWHILVIASFHGILQAIHMPATNALIYQSVGPHRLLNAMAARMLAMNLMRIVGSATAGTLISRFGMASCYLVLAASTYSAPVLLLFMRGIYRSPVRAEPFWRVAGEGIKYAWTSDSVRLLLLMSMIMELFGFSHMIMLPVMARDVLDVGASGLGFLSAAGGIGAMVSTLVVAGMGDFKNKSGLLVTNAAAAGVFLLLFALSPWYMVSLGLVAAVGASLMAYDVTMGTLLQLLSSDAVRGRVLGLYGLTFGFTSVGGFLTGLIATVASAPFAIGIDGVIIVMYVLRVLGPVRRILNTEEETIQALD